MAIKALLVPDSFSTTATDYFIVDAGETWAVTTLFFSNYSSNDQTISVWITDETLASSWSPADKNRIVNDLVIPIKDTYIFDIPRIILDAGWKIIPKVGNASAVNVLISYMVL